MDIVIKYSRSAFKRGIFEDDINHALVNVLYDELIEGTSDKYLLLGNDSSGRSLEIMYNIVDDNAVCIFHAMKIRDSFTKLLA